MIRRRRLIAPWMMVVGLLTASAAGAATPPPGTLSGEVRTGTSTPIAGARVAVDRQDGSPGHEQVQTDARGLFRLDALPPGRYTITAEAEALTPQSFDVLVLPGRTTGVLFQLIVDPAAAYRQRMAREARRQQLVAEGLARSAAADDTGAIAQFQQTVVLDPACAVCFVDLGRAQARLKHDVDAEASFKQAIALNPDYAEAYDALASLYNTRRDFARAIENGARAVDLAGRFAPDAASNYRYNQGVYLWNAGRIAEARAAFEASLRLDPGNADAHYELALALINQNEAGPAIEQLKAYLKLSPDGANASRARTLLSGLGGQ